MRAVLTLPVGFLIVEGIRNVPNGRAFRRKIGGNSYIKLGDYVLRDDGLVFPTKGFFVEMFGLLPEGTSIIVNT